MARTATRKRTTRSKPKAKQGGKRTVAEMAADPPRIELPLTSQVMEATAQRWTEYQDTQGNPALGCVEVRVEARIYGDGGCFFGVSRHRHPGSAEDDNCEIRPLDGDLRPEEVELFSLALAETVRLGKERGVFAGGAK